MDFVDSRVGDENVISGVGVGGLSLIRLMSISSSGFGSGERFGGGEPISNVSCIGMMLVFAVLKWSAASCHSCIVSEASSLVGSGGKEDSGGLDGTSSSVMRLSPPGDGIFGV